MILFINPWVYDFTAYDLWAKPLGLIEIYSYLTEQGIDTAFFDFLYQDYDSENRVKRKKDGRAHFFKEEIALPEAYQKIKIKRKYHRFGLSEKDVLRKLSDFPKPKIIFVTSIMTYWYLGVFDTIRFLKKIYPNVPIVLGGIYAKFLPEHAKKSGADYVISNNDYQNIKEILKKELNIEMKIPANRLDIQFKMEIYPNLSYIPLRFSIGCPYRCPYCGSGFLEPNYNFSHHLKSIKDYFLLWYEKGIRDFAFYDDALLLNKEKLFIPFFEWVIKNGYFARFHTPNALHINLFDEKCAEIAKYAQFKTLRFGFETALREKFFENKTDVENLKRVANILKKEGVSPADVRIYLIAGMPEQTYEDVLESIKLVKSLGFIPIPNEYSPVPNTPLFEKAKLYSPFDIENEPLYHNKTIVSCRWEKQTYEDVQKLKFIARDRSMI